MIRITYIVLNALPIVQAKLTLLECQAPTVVYDLFRNLTCSNCKFRKLTVEIDNGREMII